MIYNENGIIINDYTSNESVLEYINNYHKIDELLQEAITMKDVKMTVVRVGRAILDKILGIIDWIQRLPFLKKIHIIKKNRVKINKIINEMMKKVSDNEYTMSLKDDIMKYMNANFKESIFDLSRCFSKLMENTQMTKEEIEKELYTKTEMSYIYKDTETAKSNYFNNNDNIVKITFGSADIYGEDITNFALNINTNIKDLRSLYSNAKAFNTRLTKGNKISTENINIIHSFVVKSIQSFKKLSTACIYFCIKALNLYEKHNGDINKISEEIGISYDLSDDQQIELVKNYEYGKIKNPSDKAKLEYIKKNPRDIYYMDDQSEDLVIKAIEFENYHFDITKIKNPTEKILYEFIQKYHSKSCITYLKNIELSESNQLLLIEKDELHIIHIKNPTEKVQLIAVEKDPFNIRYIKNPSEKLQFAAVEKDPYYINYIENPTKKVLDYAKSQGVDYKYKGK